MPAPPLLVEHADTGVVSWRLNRPERRNALDGALVAALHDAVGNASERAAVLASADPAAFCGGADLDLDDPARAELSDELYALYAEMIQTPTVLVAAVNGAAVGGGAQLAAACDLRVAGPAARFRFAGPGHGLAVGAWALPGIVGRGRALDLCLTMRWVDAEEALRIGLVDRLVDDPEAEALALAEGFARLDPGATARTKAVVGTASGQAAALEAEAAGNRATWSGSVRGANGARPAADGGAPPGLAPRDTPSLTARAAWERHLGRRVEPAALREELTRGSLTEAFRAVAAAFPDRPALAVGEATATHGELDDRAARVGGWLRAQGVRPGDRVLVAGESSIALLVAYLGILRARAAMVPADPAATLDELAQLADDSGAVLAWGSGEATQRLLRVDALRTVGSLDADRSGAAVTLDEAARTGEPLPAGGSPEDLALLAYTSGTTGRPKGVPLTHANLLASLRAAAAAWRWSAGDVLVHGLPLSHQHGLSGVQMALLTGARAVVAPRFAPEELCRAVEAARATVVFAVPAMYEKLLAWEGLPAAALSTVRLWVSGSAPLSPALARRVAAALGAPPLERYGSTETGLSVSNPVVAGERRIGAVGLPLPGLEVAVADTAGRPVAPGEDGEVLLRGPQVLAGYWRQEDATQAAFTGEGWFRTGDLGRLDPADGFLTLTGRLKEMILTGGLNVSPREVELVLEDHPAVERAAVVGVPSERWGEEVVAFVVPAREGEEVEADVLIRHARERLSAYKCPKRAFTVPALPLSDTGKVRRAELVDMATSQTQEA